MGYAGKTYIIPCNRGGFNHSSNINLLPPEMMINGTKNLDLSKDGRGKRGGTSHVNGTALTDTPRLMGIYDYIKPGGTAWIVFATGDGKIWKTASATIKTGLTASKKMQMETFDDEVFFSNGQDIPSTWNGTDASVTDLASVPTDWGSGNYPSQIVKHGRGNTERMWAIGCASNPYTFYISPNGSGKDFSDANVTTLNVQTGDGYGVVGAIEFGDKMIAFGRKQAYIIDDADTDTTYWGYYPAPWKGGAAHHRVIVKTPNDIAIMAEDGDIYSVIASEQSGDYKAASLTKPSWIHEWIKDNVRMSYIDDFHGIYDPVLRILYFFVVRSGQTTVDTALAYYIDRGPQEGWMIMDNQDYASGFSASCSALIRVGAGDYQVYTGGYSGFLWKLNQSTYNDNANGYHAGFKTPTFTFGNSRKNKHFKRGWLTIVPKGTETFTVNWWVDEVAQTAQTATVSGAPLDYPFDLGAVGERLQLQVYNETANENTFVSQISIDYKELGSKPA